MRAYSTVLYIMFNVDFNIYCEPENPKTLKM